MGENRLALTAHLMRRAGFGATREELEALAERDYEGLVEDLVNPERFPPVDEDVLERYYGWLEGVQGKVWAGVWIYRMVNSQRPLEEKMALSLASRLRDGACPKATTRLLPSSR